VTTPKCQPHQPPAGADAAHPDTALSQPPFVLDVQLAFFVMASLLLSAKLVTVLLLPVIAVRRRKASRSNLILRLVAILTLAAIPIDLGVPLKHNGLQSDGSASGPRLVRTVVGMPAHTALIAKYGEYWTLGCSGRPCIIQPKYVFVWWSKSEGR
jgi:hypothetical protein